MALKVKLYPPLSAEEVRQLMIMTSDDIDVPESNPDHTRTMTEQSFQVDQVGTGTLDMEETM